MMDINRCFNKASIDRLSLDSLILIKLHSKFSD